MEETLVRKYLAEKLKRAVAVNLLLLGMFFGAVAVEVLRESDAKATSKPITILKTPTTKLTLAQNAVVGVPTAVGNYCNVTVWNNSVTPVFWGGPKIGGVTTANVTVNATNGMPICTDTTVCPAPFVIISVMTGGFALLQTAVASLDVRYLVGEGCQP